MTSFHFIRPYCLLIAFPFLLLTWYMLKSSSKNTAWSKVCDAHLLPYLIQGTKHKHKLISILSLILSITLMIISLAGPAWSRWPVPTYNYLEPRVLVLDMSDAMAKTDLKPSRLDRAKFKLHDLFMHKNAGQFALVVYANEPFVVSPLTDDSETIDALLSALQLNIIPSYSDSAPNLRLALEQAAKLISQAGFVRGQIIVLIALAPTPDAINAAKDLAHRGINTSIVPILSSKFLNNNSFESLAQAGAGELINLSDESTDIEKILANSKQNHSYTINKDSEVSLWRDQGRWFLLPAIFFLLPAWRRGWLIS